MTTTTANRLIEAREVQRAYNLLFSPGQVVELRVLEATTSSDRYTSTSSGYFDNNRNLLEHLSQFRSALGFYVTLQKCNPELINRAENKLRRVKNDKDKSTSDKDITRYNWLLIDCDPDRPAGMSSTEEEHTQAFELCQQVRASLSQLGWSTPILADSGNGWHLLYKIDLPPEDADLVKRVLVTLGEKFDTPTIHIDRSVFNPARICKLYGTLACKGDNTTRRPHRLSRIVDAPEHLEIISREQLETLAIVAATPNTVTRTPAQRVHQVGEQTLKDWLDKMGIAYSTDKEQEEKYILEDGCPFDPSHAGKDAAVFVRDGKWCFHCFHASCVAKSWKDFRLHFEPNAYTPKISANTTGGQSPVYIPSAPPAPDEPFNLTDLGNAERFALRYKDTVRWCGTWNAWMIFNGKCWEQDKIGRVGQLAKIIVRSIYAEASKMEDEKMRPKLAKHAAASESNRSVRAMLDLAKSELPALPDDFNKHLYLVNFENGTYDVQTGELHPHSPHDMLSRCIKYKYNPLSGSERWKDFISTIFGGDVDLISFMQQALGMSLCGDTSEQCLFICHGMGSNGKTTLLEIVRILMASYACAANIETFQMRKTETIGNDVAELYGARLVTASETKLGGRLNEAFVKKATGKEPLRARRLHENEFEFMPEFTLWLAVNHKPVVLDTSKGMWRRVRFIPFNVTFEEKDIDPQFGNKLLEEAEGILAWLVQGCREWIKQGRLSVPQVVKEATEGYRAEMDIVANFLRDECILKVGAKASTKQLIERFELWCGHNSEKFDAKILKNSLKERGLHSQRGTGGSYYWQDIGLIAGPDPQNDDLWSEGSEGPQKDLSSDSERSEGSEPKNRVNQELKNPPDANLNSRSLPSLRSLNVHSSEGKETLEEQEQALLILFNEVRVLLDTSRKVATDKNGGRMAHWPKKLGGYPGGFIPIEAFQVQLLEMVTSGDKHKMSAVTALMQEQKRILSVEDR